MMTCRSIRHLLRYSLRTMLRVTAVLCVLLGMEVREMNKQWPSAKAAIDMIDPDVAAGTCGTRAVNVLGD